MSDDFTLELEARSAGQSGISQARQDGKVPGIVYGPDLAPTPIQVSSKGLANAITRGVQYHPCKATLPQWRHPEMVVIKALERETFTQQPCHVDLMVLTQNKPVTMAVPIRLMGERELLQKGYQAMLQVHTVTVHAQPDSIPEALEVAVEELKTGDTLRIGDLKLPQGVTLQEPPDHTLLTVVRANRTHGQGEEEAGTDSTKPSGS